MDLGEHSESPIDKDEETDTNSAVKDKNGKSKYKASFVHKNLCLLLSDTKPKYSFNSNR